MENFTYCTPTRYVFGRGAENKAGELSARMLGNKVLIVYGKGSVVRSGLLDRVRKSLSDASVEWTELGDIDRKSVV